MEDETIFPYDALNAGTTEVYLVEVPYLTGCTIIGTGEQVAKAILAPPMNLRMEQPRLYRYAERGFYVLNKKDRSLFCEVHGSYLKHGENIGQAARRAKMLRERLDC
jgi:hypothetical protein